MSNQEVSEVLRLILIAMGASTDSAFADDGSLTVATVVKKVQQLKAETNANRADADKFKLELMDLEAHSKCELDQLKAQLETYTMEIAQLKFERDESTGAFKEVLALKNSKIRQMEIELEKNRTVSAIYQTELNAKIAAESSGFAGLERKIDELTEIMKGKEVERSDQRKISDVNYSPLENISVSTGASGQRTLMGYNGKYMRAWNGPFGVADLCVDMANNCLRCEHWYIERYEREVMLKSRFCGKYLRAHPDGSVDLTGAPGNLSQWSPVKNEDGTWSFQSALNSWLSSHREDNVVCTMAQLNLCERFTLGSW